MITSKSEISIGSYFFILIVQYTSYSIFLGVVKAEILLIFDIFNDLKVLKVLNKNSPFAAFVTKNLSIT